MAGHGIPAQVSASAHVAPALLRVLDRLDDSPALVISSVGESLAQNRMADALFGEASARTGWERSDMYRWFRHPDTERTLYPEDDRDRQSRAFVANLRAAYGAMGDRSRAGDLVRELQRVSPEFAELWDRHEVAKRFEDHKVLVHPEVGPIELDCQVLFTEDQSQALLVLTASSDDAEAKLRLLSVLGTQAFSADTAATGTQTAGRRTASGAVPPLE
jgi:hypothetical protein